MLKIHELVRPDGELSPIALRAVGPSLVLFAEDEELPLPDGALRAVMHRYGAPFDPEATSMSQGVLELPGGASLRHVRHRAGYDVIARDYLVYAEPGHEPLCVMATTVAGALRHLGLARASGEQR